jgi:tRNA-specific 2-thiouridylase
MPFHVRSIEDRMRPVIEQFVYDYQRGRTPNPCPLCNASVKLACLLELADEIGAESVATGHYARILHSPDGPAIGRAECAAKDQSYVLFAVRQSLLRRLLLPLADVVDKRTVRQTAHKLGLNVGDKPDSQDICFVPSGDYTDLLAEHSSQGLLPGPVYDPFGRYLGVHGGYARYTVGQRRGLGIASTEPLYVIQIRPENNSLILGPYHLLLTRSLDAGGAVWQQPVPSGFRGEVQVRYHGQPVGATLSLSQDARHFSVAFHTPADCAVPGQAAVVYDGDRLLGGGWIESVRRVVNEEPPSKPAAHQHHREVES